MANNITSNAWVDVNDGTGNQKEYLVQQGATSTYPMQVFDLENSTGRFVRLDILSNHGNPFVTTLGEVAFDVSAVAAVPEPSTYAMLLAGLGLLSFAKRRVQV